MRKLIGFIFLAIILSGCSSKFRPCTNDLFEIHNSQYVLRVNDCCDKSVKYCNRLNASGFNANVVVGRIDRLDGYHAFVQIEENEIVYYADPTFNMVVAKSERWRGRTVTHIYRKKVTAEDVRTYRNVLHVVEVRNE